MYGISIAILVFFFFFSFQVHAISFSILLLVFILSLSDFLISFCSNWYYLKNKVNGEKWVPGNIICLRYLENGMILMFKSCWSHILRAHRIIGAADWRAEWYFNSGGCSLSRNYGPLRKAQRMEEANNGNLKNAYI